ncbi:glycoside hydrolase family 28 protein [Bifidobacterium vespertilionis]|uniref:Glycoside hydrolase family 28 protein n=1 Tax=Bifidobacterium vespertilionis TaxID=2562524 RepID=A0A5J5E573_9BIFI|nr:glycoside hydrolase family 28 protein [Bifidobacterium vespertilionis]KAA8821381.1 glycoside hydrolase family 28 protein [Bifidobacterium vespertilionis]KAA8824326.1 glycoside hydrolase family 28 protein [Bifidobacterium vespertilionis]
MQLELITVGARFAVIEMKYAGIWRAENPWKVFVNGELKTETDHIVTYLDGLEPDTEQIVRYEPVASGGMVAAEPVEIAFTTKHESFTLNVRDFGAIGDGVHDDTQSIMAAIMAAPRDARVLVPAGDWRVKNIFLKSDITLDIAEGATIRARHDRENLAYLPVTQTATNAAKATNAATNAAEPANAPCDGYNGTGLLPLGTWEGESVVPMFCGVITGIGLENVTVCGRGAIDGGANRDEDNWWFEPKRIRIAARPHMVFLSDCDHATFAGITVRNSPSWNFHPTLCRDFTLACVTIESPKVSPNTDGFDPESCDGVRVIGTHFSVGDDCIAVKSGKISMPRSLRPACRNMIVEQCYMHDGHGSVVLGSEASGGIENLTVRDCLFERTDRGLRIKSRRGRGKDSIYRNIRFEHIRMDEVLTPFVVNSFYFCDPDGKTDYVQTREPLPVDDRTPKVESLEFRDIEALNCHAAATWITGLPESKVGKLEFHNIHVTFSPDAEPTTPAMACQVEPMVRQGIIAQNVETLVLDDVRIEGQDGDELQLTNVDRVVRQ